MAKSLIMSYKKLLTLALIIFGIVVVLFESGSSELTYNVFEIPVGNFIIWFGVIALELCAFSLKKDLIQAQVFSVKLLQFL